MPNKVECDKKKINEKDYLSKEEREKYNKYCIESNNRIDLLKKEKRKHNDYYIEFDRRIERLDEELNRLLHCKALWENTEELIQSGNTIKMEAGKKAQSELVSKGIVILLPGCIEKELEKAIKDG